MHWPPETFIARLTKGLLDAGLNVTIAGHVKPGPEWQAYSNFDWLRAPSWGGSKLRRILRFGALLARAALHAPKDLAWFWRYSNFDEGLRGAALSWYRYLPFAGKRWDVVYFPWNGSAYVHRALLAKGMNSVVSCRGSEVYIHPHAPGGRSARTRLKDTLGMIDVVHCVSDHIAREVTAYGARPERIQVVRPAVDPLYFRADGCRPPGTKSTVVVTVGSLLWNKGYEYALLAVRELVDENLSIRFDIIGDGPDRQRILYTIDDLELQEHVRLLGRLSVEEVREHLRRSSVFLLPSLSEGISNAVLEAMACELPIVTTDCGGMPEAVTHGVDGLVVPVRDSGAMAAALTRMAADSSLRQSMGARGRARVFKDFSLDTQVRLFVDIFRDAAGISV